MLVTCFCLQTLTTRSLFYAQERGTLFIGAQQNVYEGMIVGQNSRPDDLVGWTEIRRIASSEAEALRMLVTCFCLQTLTTRSSGREF